MNNYGGRIPSADGIAAAFPHKILEKINVTPSHIDIDDAQEKQTENAASLPSTRGGGAHGHEGMVVPSARYVVQFSPTSYAWEPIPNEAPVYSVRITATAQRLLDNNFARAMGIYRDQSGTHTALKNQLHQKYIPDYWTGVVKPNTGIETISLMDMHAHLYANYGQVTERDLEKSRSGITVQFEFATLPIEQYLFKVQKCQQLHGNALLPRPITDMEDMGIAYLNLQRSGLYPLDCREWEMRPSDRKTFPSL